MVGPDHLVPVIAQTHQGETHQGRATEVEATRLIVRRQGQQRRLRVGMFTPVQFHNRHLRLLIHRLQRVRQTVAPEEGRTQHFMALQQGVPGGAETVDLQPFNRHAELVDVQVQLGRLNAVEQHALLHRRQRVQVVQPLALHLHGGRHLGKRHGVGSVRDTGCCRHGPLCQRTNGLRLEQLFRGERQAQRPRTAHGLQRDDRIAAQLEEVFSHPHGFQPQHVLPDRRQQGFCRGARQEPFRHLTAGLGRRQRLTVQFAVGGQRQRGQAH